MKKLFFITMIVMALLVVAVPAFAEGTEDPGLTPIEDQVVTPLFNPNLDFSTELVIAPFADEGDAKTLAAISVGLVDIKGGAFQVSMIGATNFDGQGLFGPSIDVNVFKAIALFSDSGSVQWAIDNIRPIIGVGVLSPINSMFDTGEWEPVIHIKIINIDI